MCKYCDLKENRIGSIWFGDREIMAGINKKNELVVNMQGQQTFILINNCPWCGREIK